MIVLTRFHILQKERQTVKKVLSEKTGFCVRMYMVTDMNNGGVID